MATIIRIEDQSKAAKQFLNYAKTLPFASVEKEKNRYNAKTEKVIAEARAGISVTNVKDYKNFIAEILK
jgi:peptidase E